MKQAASKLLILIPDYNDAKRLEKLSTWVKKTKAISIDYENKIIAIDDGSTDHFGEVAQNQNFETELLLQTGLYNNNIDEVPISTKDNAGNSSNRKVADALRFIRQIEDDNAMIRFDKLMRERDK